MMMSPDSSSSSSSSTAKIMDGNDWQAVEDDGAAKSTTGYFRVMNKVAVPTPAIPAIANPDTANATITMSQPLCLFLHALFDEAASNNSSSSKDGERNSSLLQASALTSLTEINIVTDNAASLAPEYVKSWQGVPQDVFYSGWESSMPELIENRWDSQVAKTTTTTTTTNSSTTGVVLSIPPPPAQLQSPQQQQRPTERSTASSALPTRPQRRMSFEVDRSHITTASNSSRSDATGGWVAAASQSMSQLQTQTHYCDDNDVPCKRSMPPRVPMRRTSGRVPSVQRRGVVDQQQQQQQKLDESDRFELDFSFSESLHGSSSEESEDVAANDHAAIFGVRSNVNTIDVNTASHNAAVEQLTQDLRAMSGMGYPSATTSASASASTITTPRMKRAASVDTGLRKPQRQPESPKSPANDNDKNNSSKFGEDQPVPPMAPLTSKAFASDISEKDECETVAAGESDTPLPHLETIVNPPHRRSLPRQLGFCRLEEYLALQKVAPGSAIHNDDFDTAASTEFSSIADQSQPNPTQQSEKGLTNTSPQGDDSDDLLQTVKLASTKMSPPRKGGKGMVEMVGVNDSACAMLEASPTTIHKAVKKSLLGRINKGRNNAPKLPAATTLAAVASNPATQFTLDDSKS